MTDAVRYGVTCAYIGFDKDVPISAEEFAAAQRARVTLSVGLGVEEKFDIALENHADLERHLLDMALEYSLFPGRIDELLNHARRSTNRRLTNYLATARLYVDQVKHDISEALQDGGRVVARIRKVMNAQYDDRFGYRAMEALRNHAQHRGLPVNAISFPIVHEERFQPARSRFSVVPAIGVRELAQDKKFKPPILEELKQRANGNGLIALMPLLRQYSEGLGAVHREVRTQLKAPLETAERTFQTLTE